MVKAFLKVWLATLGVFIGFLGFYYYIGRMGLGRLPADMIQMSPPQLLFPFLFNIGLGALAFGGLILSLIIYFVRKRTDVKNKRLAHLSTWFAAIYLTIFLTMVTTVGYIIRNPRGTLPVIDETRVLQLVNEYREQNGKQPFTLSNELCTLASVRADVFMRNEQEAVKTSKIGAHIGFGDDVAKYKYEGAIGENYYANGGSEENAIEWWKFSPPHNDLMLITEYQGSKMDKACVGSKVTSKGSIVVLLVGEK